jgi:YVTN family beta-propeller protein
MILLGAALALAPSASAGPTAYVAQGGSEPGATLHALAVFDVATGAKLTSIDLPSPAIDVAIDPTGTRAYVTMSSGLAVVDLDTNTVVTTIAGASGADVAVDPSGKRVYVADDVNKITVVDTATNTVIGPGITVGKQPRAVVVNAAGTRAYTGNTLAGSYSISIVDLTTDLQTSELTNVNLNRPENLGIVPDGTKVYAANFGMSAGGTTVAVLDVATNNFAPVTVGTTPTAATPNPSGTRMYVVNRDSMSLSVLDGPTGVPVVTFPLGFSAIDMAVTPDGTRAVLSTSQEDRIAFIDLASGRLYSGPKELIAGGGVAIRPAQPPVPAFAVAPGVSGEATKFDASSSSGGPIVRYDWDFGDGGSAPDGGSKLSHVYAAPGTYQAKLTVTNGCDPNAVFGPLDVSFGGHTAFCRRPSTDSKTVAVVIPAVALGVVRTSKARVGGSGVARLQVACIKELDCAGTLSLKTVKKFKIGKHARARIALGSKPFKTIRAGHKRTIKLKLSKAGLGLVRSHKTLTATATASVRNPSGGPRRRSRQVVIKRG